MPKERTFWKWLINSYSGIMVSAGFTTVLGMYAMLTIISWLVDGNFDGNYQHRDTLAKFVFDQWRWIWSMLHHLW